MTTASRTLQQLDTSDFYIANQLTPEGLDELQRMLLLYRHGLHAALDGPSGVGKTRAIIEIAQILNVPLFTKNCSSRTTESHIISYPSLTVKDGASVTIQISGPLIRALHTPGIFYGDEFNLLKEDVQKRLNSAFDERRSIDRSDGRLIRAKPGFWGVISYNPTQNLAIQDLEDSVADRFVHLQFERWNSDFKAYISACKASNNGRSPEARRHDFGIDLEERGIDPQTLQFYRRVSDQDGSMAWQDFFTGKSISTKPAYTYLSRRTKPLFRGSEKEVQKGMRDLDEAAFRPVQLARMISLFTDLLGSLSRTGRSPLLTKIGLGEIHETEDLEILELHDSSTRIEIAALKVYHDLLERGWSRYLSQATATRMIIDQICYGRYRERDLREVTASQLVLRVANNMKLVADSANYNTNLISEKLLFRMNSSEGNSAD